MRNQKIFLGKTIWLLKRLKELELCLDYQPMVKLKKEWQEAMYNLECGLEENSIAKQTAFLITLLQ